MLEVATWPVSTEAPGKMFASVGALPIHAPRAAPWRAKETSSRASAVHHVATPASESTGSTRPHWRAPVAGWWGGEVVDVGRELHEPWSTRHHHVVHHAHHVRVHVGIHPIHVRAHSIHVRIHSIYVGIHSVHVLWVEVRRLVAHVGCWVARFIARVEVVQNWWWKLGRLSDGRQHLAIPCLESYK